MIVGPTSEGVDADVVILGGGIAGLVVGVALSDAGLRVMVLERDELLGGRARSWTDPTTGDPVHIGPHIFLSQYPNMLKFMELLGTRNKVVWDEDQLIRIVDGRTEIVGKVWRTLPAPLHFIPSLFADKSLSLLDRASGVPVGLLAMQLTEEDVLDLDGINAYALLRAMGVTSRYIERFWDPTCMYIMNTPVELCSAGALLRFFRFLVGHNDYKVGFPDGGLGDVYAPQAMARIESRGGRVLTKAKARRLIPAEDRVEAVELSDGRHLRASHYVSALPPKALLDVLPREWVLRHGVFKGLGDLQACPYIAVYLWFDRKLTPLRFWARAYKQGDLNSDFYDFSNIYRGWEDRPSLIGSNIIFSSRLGEMSDEEILAGTLGEIAEFIPEVTEAKVVHSVLNRIPMAVTCPFPGSERRRAPARSPISNLVLAGDWTRTGLPASMESAARSGWIAAEHVLATAGRPARFSLEHTEATGLAGLVHKMGNLFPVKPALRRIFARARRG